jgi:predicted RNA-binding Zn-ribbon protein involved in translation (DUF1610 family)
MATETATMHPFDLSMDDVLAGRARLVQCPDCGQMELWTKVEWLDHGLCRSRGDRDCPTCGDWTQQVEREG